MTLVTVSLESIVVKDRIRQDMGKGSDSLIELANSLESTGLIHPIVLNGVNLKAGGRRFMATMFLYKHTPPRTIGGLLAEHVPLWHLFGDRTRVPAGQNPDELVTNPRRLAPGQILAVQYHELDRKTQLQIEIEENVRRKDFNKAEEALGIERLRKLIAELEDRPVEEISHRELAKTAQVSHGTVTMALRVAKAVREGHSELLSANSVKGAYDKLQTLEKLKTRIEAVKAAVPRDVLTRNTFNGKAEDWLPTLADKSIDVHLFDPPWGIDIDTFGMDKGDDHWKDDYEYAIALQRACMSHLYRTLRDNSYIVMFFGMQFIEKVRRMLEHAHCCQGKNKQQHNPIGFKVPPVPHIWYKPNKKGAQSDPSRFDMNQYEPFFVAQKGDPRIFKGAQGNVLCYDMPLRSERFHTAQKPVALYKDILERYSFGNMTVCDCTAGSFSSIKAAKQLGRQYYACELNPEDYEQGLMYVHEPEK